MAETRDLDTKRAAERRLALLALIGKQPQPSGSCPDPEELACLVEGRLEPEDAEACLAHLAACEQCYAAWRQLDQLGGHQQVGSDSIRGRLLPLFRRPRFLAAAGSLLATAAGIAVFLHITTQADRKALMHYSAKPSRQVLTMPAPEPADNLRLPQEQPLAPAPPPLAKRREKKAPSPTDRGHVTEQETAAPAEASAARAPAKTVKESLLSAVAPPSPGRIERSAADRSAEEKQATRDTMVATAAPEPARPRQAGQTAAALSDRAVPAVPLSLADWRRNVREACQGRPGPDVFADMALQGRHLLDTLDRDETTLLAPQDRQQVNTILALLTERQQQSPDQRCQALLNLLDLLEPADRKEKQ